MKTCGLAEDLLHVWFDGEAGSDAQRIEAHIANCSACSTQVRAWRTASLRLSHIVDEGIADVEPLLALRSIRERIQEAEDRNLWSLMRHQLEHLWLLHRHATIAAVTAAVLGALIAPGLLWWISNERQSSRSGLTASPIVVESLEYQDDAHKAVVYNGSSGLATLIWLAPTDRDSHAKHTSEKF